MSNENNDYQRSYSLVKDLEFERISGSKDEINASEIIIDRLNEINSSNVYYEEFNVSSSIVKKVVFKIVEPYLKEYEATMVTFSENTTEVIKDFVYAQNCYESDLSNVFDKIVLINGRITYDIYEQLCKAKVYAIVSFSGTLYDDLDKTNLEERMLRPRHFDNGKIPSICIRISDALEIVSKKGSKALIELEEETLTATSRNVIAKINGSSNLDEEIVFTAHYDSVRFSKGSYDNATGCATILALYKYYTINPPMRDVTFIFCGSEERGLLGSFDYVKRHKDELDKVKFCLNVDMTSVILGYDICVCTTQMSVVNTIEAHAKELAFPIKVSQGVYSSDSTPFAEALIPSVSFARISAQGGKVIHNLHDNTDFLSYDSFKNTLDFIISFSSRLINSKVFYIEKKMPDEMIKEIDKYLGKNKKEK